MEHSFEKQSGPRTCFKDPSLGPTVWVLGTYRLQLCLDLVKVSHSHTTCPVDDLVEAHVHFNPFQWKMTKNRIKKKKKELYQDNL